MAVGALLLWGADPVQSARTGSRWKRRLIIAGLALLAILGIYVSRNTLRDWICGLWPTTCYAQAETDDVETTPERVAARVELLKEFAARDKLEPEVVRKQLSAIDQDLDAMQQYAEKTQMQHPEALRRMAEVRREANKLKDELKARLEERK
jgi:peptidoglycan hydrolase CwlO-like protein